MRFGLFVAAVLLALGASGAAAQKSHCTVICAPALSAIPGISISNVMNAPDVRPLSAGAEHKLASKKNLLLGLALDAPTQLKWLDLFVWATWLPTATRGNNPFTQYTAAETGDTIHANHVNLALGAKLHALPMKRTGGWLGIDGDIYDNYTPAARPKDTSTYTHKLALQADALVGLFNWLAPRTWLHAVTGYASLTYAASGLPKAGDVVPAGVRQFVSDAHPFSLAIGLAVPLAPLVPKH